jgi:hypothetical protein
MHCCGRCCIDWLRPCGGCCRDDHEEKTIVIDYFLDHKEETIVIDYFLYTDARLHWIATPTLLPLLSTSSGNNDL